MLKLLVVIPNFYPAIIYGGPIFTALHTCEKLAALGIEVRVSTTNANMTNRLNIESNIWIKKDDNFFIKYYNETIINKFSFPLLFNLWRDIKQADLVHIQYLFSAPTPIAIFYSVLLRKPILLTPHGSMGNWCLNQGSKLKSYWLNWLIKPFLSNIIWHATAEMEKNEILTVFPNAQIEVISNGIQINEFQTINLISPVEFSEKFIQKILQASKIIVSMGRLQKKKGFDILIDSFSYVIKIYPEAKLFIAGQDEGEKENLQLQIKALGLLESVFFVGAISGQDKIDFLANADLFVLASHNENFGIVYAESLAAGTPIIASKNTPWSEIESANCGKWIPNTVQETTNAIIDMLGKDRELMRVNAKKVAQKYEWNSIALQFKTLFLKMLEMK